MFSVSNPSPQSLRFIPNRLGWLMGLTTLSTLTVAPTAIAQTILPTAPGLDFQTSGPDRPASIGDWYTSNETASTEQIHRFFINITQEDLDLAGGSVSITVNEAESFGAADEVQGDPDPTRFRLLDPSGAVIQEQVFPPGTADGTAFTFPAITQPGVYQVTSETGAQLIGGENDGDDSDDDNSFELTIPIPDLLVGNLQGSFQFNGTDDTVDDETTDLELFVLVGPGTEELELRNFDLDSPAFDDTVDVFYSRASTPLDAAEIDGTESGQAEWNGGGGLNAGGDVYPIDPNSTDDAGIWTITLDDYRENNQTVIEANIGPERERVPVLDTLPDRGGNFTITQDTTLTTNIGSEVCHPFTVTNNFFTSDIINLSATGTDPDVIAQLRDANGNPLTDTDGDGQVDTGILAAGASAQFFLCVTPQPGAPSVDITTITGTSFMDAKLRQQSGNPDPPTEQSVEKRTLIPAPSIGLAKTNSALRPVAGAPGVFDVDLTFVVENTGTSVLNEVQIEEDLQAVFVDTPQVGGVASDGADDILSVTLTDLTFTGSGTAPTFNPDYNGDSDIELFDTPGNSFNPGDSASITITVQLDLTSDGTLDVENSAIATGSPPDGAPVEDVSQSGGDVDPDNDGDPTNNDDPNRIRIPSIGVAKTVGDPELIGGTTYEFDYTIRVENTGTVPLDNVQLTENLQDALINNAFNRADSFTVENVALSFPDGDPTVPPTLNPFFNGTSVQTLFDDTAPNTFDEDESAEVVITVQADLGPVSDTPSVDGLGDGILNAQNFVQASGNPPGGVDLVTDISQDGTDVDPDNDGNPNNNSVPTTLLVNTGPNLSLVKRITNVFRNGAPVAVPGITQFNDQDGFVEDNALNTALGGGNALPGLFVLPGGFALQPDDEVEYTIYFWNNGGSDINQLALCDELEPPSVLNTTLGFELSAVRNVTPPVFFGGGPFIEGRSPGAPLEPSCLSAPGAFPIGPPGPTGGLGVGAGGGVVAGPFDVPPNQFGAIRFRVRIP